jgi:hypothetical protein
VCERFNGPRGLNRVDTCCTTGCFEWLKDVSRGNTEGKPVEAALGMFAVLQDGGMRRTFWLLCLAIALLFKVQRFVYVLLVQASNGEFRKDWKGRSRRPRNQVKNREGLLAVLIQRRAHKGRFFVIGKEEK